MATPWFEVLVAGAERQFAEAGKVQNLSFWAYKILIRARRQEYQNPPLFPRTHSQGSPENFKVGEGYVDYCAWRRYSDLEWFRTHLALEHPGVVLPPIPEKDTSAGTGDKMKDLVKSEKGSQKETAQNNPLIALRIRRLQLFFNALLSLNEVYVSEHLRAFVSMEEAEWIKYKQAVEAKLHPEKGWEKVKSTGFSFFSAVKNLTQTKVHVFDEMSGLGKIRKQQLEMADALMVSSRQISNMLRCAYPKEIKDPHQLDGVNMHNAGKPLPPSLVYNGHLVASGGKSGVVRHVDESDFAWVDFNEGGKLQKVSVNQLGYPNTGICDPAAVAVHHHLTQMESYFAYMGRAQIGQDCLKLQDAIWFEGQFCHAVAESVNAVEEIEKKRLQLTKTIAGEKDAAKRASMQTEADNLQAKFAQMCTKVSQDYDRVFRPRQRKALALILPQIGPLLAGLLNDNDWNDRLAPADASLPLLFDVPEQVIQEQRNAKYSDEPAGYGAKTAAPTPAPAQPVSASPDRRHADPFAAADMGPYSPPKEAAPAPTPYQPAAVYNPPQESPKQAPQPPPPHDERTEAEKKGPIDDAVTNAVYAAKVNKGEEQHREVEPEAPAAGGSTSNADQRPEPGIPPPSDTVVAAPPPPAETYSMPPPSHDEEPPPPPEEEEEEAAQEGTSGAEGSPDATEAEKKDDEPEDGNPSSHAMRQRSISLAGPVRETKEEEPEWDGEGPPPMPDTGDHDV